MRAQLVIEKLRELRDHALEQGAQVQIRWSSEDSRMVRYATSAVSLNSHEAITRLEVMALGDHRQATASLTADEGDMEAMKATVDKAIQMLPFAPEMSYQPTLPVIEATSISDESFYPAL